jgi:hypothetical protein
MDARICHIVTISFKKKVEITEDKNVRLSNTDREGKFSKKVCL